MTPFRVLLTPTIAVAIFCDRNIKSKNRMAKIFLGKIRFENLRRR